MLIFGPASVQQRIYASLPVGRFGLCHILPSRVRYGKTSYMRETLGEIGL